VPDQFVQDRDGAVPTPRVEHDLRFQKRDGDRIRSVAETIAFR
jgi:hypothetical protein